MKRVALSWSAGRRVIVPRVLFRGREALAEPIRIRLFIRIGELLDNVGGHLLFLRRAVRRTPSFCLLTVTFRPKNLFIQFRVVTHFNGRTRETTILSVLSFLSAHKSSGIVTLECSPDSSSILSNEKTFPTYGILNLQQTLAFVHMAIE